MNEEVRRVGSLSITDNAGVGEGKRTRKHSP